MYSIDDIFTEDTCIKHVSWPLLHCRMHSSFYNIHRHQPHRLQQLKQQIKKFSWWWLCHFEDQAYDSCTNTDNLVIQSWHWHWHWQNNGTCSYWVPRQNFSVSYICHRNALDNTEKDSQRKHCEQGQPWTCVKGELTQWQDTEPLTKSN